MINQLLSLSSYVFILDGYLVLPTKSNHIVIEVVTNIIIDAGTITRDFAHGYPMAEND